jgi:putative ABC transport system permease protein
MKNQIAPPKWATRFLQWFCNDHLAEAVLGDLQDLYERRVKVRGKRKADLWFVWNVFQFIQPFALRKRSRSEQLNSITMFKNYFKVTWRGMTRQKMYTAIKIGGFALGLATCIIISLFIRHEMSYDAYYSNTDRIYRLINHWDQGDGGKWTAFPPVIAPILKNEFPEVELSARLIPYKWFNAGNNLMRRDDQTENIYEEGFAYADPDLLEILEIPMVYGSRKHALAQPNTIVLSKSKADKYFPGEDPTGKIIVLNDEKNQSLTVGGVMEDFPPNSHLSFNFFITLTEKEFWQGEQTDWCCWNYNPYVRLKPGVDPRELEQKMLGIKKTYIDYLAQRKDQNLEQVKKHHRFILQPVSDVHLRSEGIGDIITHSDIKYIWLFGGIAAFILVLACINFVNLSTAKSANRAKEVGLRKVVGSVRGYLVSQFLSESVIFSLASFIIAIALVAVMMPFFNQMAGKPIIVPWTAWWFFPVLIGSSILIGLIAGVYPAFYLSAFKPIDVLKGSVARGMKGSGLRSAMVVFQFTTSIILIVGTFIIYSQMNFILTTKVGFDKDQVVMIQGTNTLDRQQQTFKEELLKLATVENVTLSQYFPVDGTTRDQNQFWKDGKSQVEKSFGAQAWFVDENYIPTLGMKLVAGRNFSRDMASDSSAVIINEAMAKEFGFENPIGEHIMNFRSWTIIGVVENFNFENMKGEIEPLCFMRGGYTNIAGIKVKSANMQDAIQSITSVWNKFRPTQPIRYTFLDESYARMYDDVKRTGDMFATFAILAIVVACLGLFALSSFMVEQRNKEISIRLVLGASLKSIFKLLTEHFVILVLISFVIAVPLSWYIMKKWLEDYQYKIELSWEIFVLSGLMAVVIALLTVSYQSVRAALENPAKNLRSE